MKSYKDLKVWKKSFNLCIKTYELLKTMPNEEKFGLTAQIKRSSISIPSNIAEGWGRGGNKYFIHFLKIARASLYELETQLMLIQELNNLVIQKELFLSIEEIGKMLNGLITKINNDIELNTKS